MPYPQRFSWLPASESPPDINHVQHKRRTWRRKISMRCSCFADMSGVANHCQQGGGCELTVLRSLISPPISRLEIRRQGIDFARPAQLYAQTKLGRQ